VAITAVVIRKRTEGAEADQILDRLEAVTGLNGERAEGARRYGLGESRDLVIAMASIRGQLEEISSTWQTHLELDLE
jgi:hypothetical protein